MNKIHSSGMILILFFAGAVPCVFSPELTMATRGEFQVNTFITETQWYPDVAMDPGGNFIIAWTSLQDASGYGIYGQRYNSIGDILGPEFQINTYTHANQMYPTVAICDAGNFVVAWESYGQDGDGRGVFAQRFDSNGNPVGLEFQVNTCTVDYQWNQDAAMDVTGNFAITWQSNEQDGSDYGVFAQRYDSAGLPQGPEFQVNTYTLDYQGYQSIGMDAAGNFVITWESYGQDGYGWGTYAQRYTSDGDPVGPEFLVNTTTYRDQMHPAVVMDSAGNFVITWQSYQDGSSFGIYAQRYDSSGTPVGSEFQVNTYTDNAQDTPSIAMDPVGNFVIAWQSMEQDGSDYGMYAQKFDSAGTPVGPEFQVNTYKEDAQHISSTSMISPDDIVITWQSFGQDGSGYGIFAQKFTPPDIPAGSAGLLCLLLLAVSLYMIFMESNNPHVSRKS